MSQETRTYARKHYFIKRDFQTRVILKFCLLLLMGLVISAVLLVFFSQGTLTSSFQHSRLVIENTSQAILPVILYTSLITLALLTVATIFVTLFISHRIAGPLFRFEKELKEIGDGNLTKQVMLRKKDQTAELAESINSMVNALREKVLCVHAELEEIMSAVREGIPPQVIEERLERLDREIKKNLRT